MKTSLRYLGLNAQAAWNRLVQEHLSLLQKLANIESAEVVLERKRNGTPAFRARMVLVVPGPDYHAEAADHTLAAALRKAVQNLKRQIQARQTKRRVNGKSNLQLGKMSSHWSSALAGNRA
jgi:ribosome-associated translation inhibitor RaiA